MTVQQATIRLAFLCDAVPERLKVFTREELIKKPAPDKWSKLEILGHLVDSAANNHQRFIRVQFEGAPTIFYDQNNWVTHNHYNELPLEGILQLWSSYNRHLVEVIKKVPTENLSRQCRMRDGRLVSLEWLITDYAKHMEHHLTQILGALDF